jgi:hypothetical protein
MDAKTNAFKQNFRNHPDGVFIQKGGLQQV